MRPLAQMRTHNNNIGQNRAVLDTINGFLVGDSLVWKEHLIVKPSPRFLCLVLTNWFFII